jgi:hypothetical protein
LNFLLASAKAEGVKAMKKLLMVALVLLISVAFVPSGFAQSKTDLKKAPTAKKQAVKQKAGARGFAGKVTTINAIMIAVKGKKATITFDTTNPKLKGYNSIGDVMIGDTVVAKYTKDGLIITKLKGQTKARAVGEKKAEEKKKQEEEVVSRVACTKTRPCTVSLDKPKELAEVSGVSLINCTKTRPCTVSLDKPKEVRIVSRVTCTGIKSCSVSYNGLTE